MMLNSFAAAPANHSPSPWTSSGPSFLLPSASRRHHHFPFSSPPPPLSSPSGNRVSCMSGSSPNPPLYGTSELKFMLHDALDSSGIDTSHARVARAGFCSQIKNLSDIERDTSISINRCVDLGRAALFVAAEDDSLVSHSSVPLPVDAFIERLDDLSMGYCSYYSSSFNSSPDHFLDSLQRYVYVKKGFHRSSASSLIDPRALYLHSVLTHRTGSAVLLSLIYSEILKMLRLWGLLNFDVEIYYPRDLNSLPRVYNKRRSKESDQLHILTVQALLEEILRDLKVAFWPFQHNHTKSLFLRAADAANCIDKSDFRDESGFDLASSKAAQYRLDRGVWTTVRLGDMRRALSACERLILIGADPTELRDYSILLYHCGFFMQSLQYLKLYVESKESFSREKLPNSLSRLEVDAEEKLMIRLNLIQMEEGWSRPSQIRNFLGNSSEPW
ncbi:hypothetical protein SAY86_029303 [Trapa natans]|uniref:Protein SirB1 N-terminal domain-containing protein n=1 Tax=Trapa natans TaxID=22666 RepID=A0AAN7M335_TRANT|nr:hypothetical protein SAY86_029303 [Trapa natans]